MLGYQVVKRLCPSNCYVYLVQKEAASFTIKTGSRAHTYLGDWAYCHVQQEIKVLERMAGIENIAHKNSAHILTIQKKTNNSKLLL